MNWIMFGLTLLVGVVVAVTISIPLVVFVVQPYSEWLFNKLEKIKNHT